ncbi:MAG: hypothetical protein NTX42_01490 [Methanothrix sp.]|nr:hypothetical protein [Methanothrix sp.]
MPSSTDRQTGHGGGRRVAQKMQGHCPTPGVRPSTMTSEPRGISGSGGSEPTRRGDGDGVDDGGGHFPVLLHVNSIKPLPSS